MPKKEETKAKEGTMVITATETLEGTTVDVDSNKVSLESVALCIVSLIALLRKEGLPMRSIKKKLKEYIKMALKGEKNE